MNYELTCILPPLCGVSLWELWELAVAGDGEAPPLSPDLHQRRMPEVCRLWVMQKVARTPAGKANMKVGEVLLRSLCAADAHIQRIYSAPSSGNCLHSVPLAYVDSRMLVFTASSSEIGECQDKLRVESPIL